jgi:hypothetical protein
LPQKLMCGFCPANHFKKNAAKMAALRPTADEPNERAEGQA